MDDPAQATSKPSWLERLTHFLLREPEDRGELVEILHSAFERHLLDADALGMIEGVLNVGDMQVRDVMVPRSQMDVIDISQSPEQFIPFVMQTAHSRFPVIDGNKDDVLGVLLAKDLLRYYAEGADNFSVRDMLRPAVYIPESKRLNVLLKDFRNNRNHMAIVVDEYGGVAGLITIEDVMEQIVGDIEDEYDYDETEDNIVIDRRGHWRVKGLTEIADLNEALKSAFSDDEFDTVAGLITRQFGHVPKRGEKIAFDGFQFQIVRADSRRVHSVLIEKLPDDEDAA
ncbi:magnesium and cobalt transporter [Andreprevotia lacus DSM 23236]|jgi:magnesium and cobalt transporter|uniref:Magnesium and cobalt efflux protein CorC n=1 Tax=Andreprevotia lacus DSM 23236 TaxID=1121001 RepID=A0A1W1X2L7_9NEIS|nr:transporter associated domain-containing protein [Andreprevotia lacus]SMC17651.1 magnesium and cobalt transporter [Andreprevotia lacus DSM 23236]